MDRSKLAGLLDRAGVPTALHALTARGASPWIPVLTYHRAMDPRDNEAFDDGVVDTTPEAFDLQMAYLAEHFDVLAIEDLLAFGRGAKLPKNPVLVTFDDGYIDNHDVVLPILLRHGIKATFFIATSYLSERRLFWWDKINWLVKRSSRTEITLTYPAEMTIPIGPDARTRRQGITRLLRIVKDRHAMDLPRFLDGLAEACGVELSRSEERALADRMLMTWEHVRALRRAGMDVQSHTSTHRVLQTVPEHELATELGGAREVLEGVLGEPVRAISYPVGKPLRYTPYIRTAVRAAGYDLGFSNGTGVNHRWSFDPLDARRISLDVSLSPAFFRSMMALPYLAY